MLVHVPAMEHGAIKTALIIGGGDGAVARQILRYKQLEHVDIAEIDQRVIDLCREHLPEVNESAFADERLQVNIIDAAEFLKRESNRGRYDLIVADRPDPGGPADSLFTDTFYDLVRQALTPSGIAVFQSGNPFSQMQESAEAYKDLGRVFEHYGVYLTVTPTYLGGYMAITWASVGFRLGTPWNLEEAQARFQAQSWNLHYYNPEIHAACFALPQWLKALLNLSK
jgi:spermidine synthase